MCVTYIAVDFEWNQPLEGAQRVSFGDDEFLCGEIIQIGAVMMDESFSITSEFNTLVRPVKYVKMNRRVEEITGITTAMTHKAPPFTEAHKQFRDWCLSEDDTIMFITWGFDDIRVLRQNCEMHGLDCSWFDKWINLQVVYNMQTSSEEAQKSLTGAMEHFGIRYNEALPMHNALGDAYYTGLICSCLDTAKGIAEYPFNSKYDRFRKKNRRSSSKTVHSGFDTKKTAFMSSEVTVCPCPACEKPLDGIKWLRMHSLQYKSRGVCDEHGQYNVRLNFSREPGTWTVTRVIFPIVDRADSPSQACVTGAEAPQQKRPQPYRPKRRRRQSPKP